MRTRTTGYREYGITQEEANTLIRLCRTADKRIERLLLESARESCPALADSIVSSLKDKLSYEKLCGRKYIYLSKSDYYGYRRMVLFLLKEKLMSREEAVIERWKNERCIRRYVSLEDAAKELQMEEQRVRTLAKKANALFKFGRLFRVDMSGLYSYLDRECAVMEEG